MKTLPAEILDRIHVYDAYNNMIIAYLLDDEVINLDKVRFMKEAHSDSGSRYHVVRYTCSDRINRLCALYCEPEITAEDLSEWMSASAGCDYYWSGR